MNTVTLAALLVLIGAGSAHAQIRPPTWNPAGDRNTGAMNRVFPARPVVNRSQREYRRLPGATLTNSAYTSALRRELENRVMTTESGAGPASPLRILDTRVVTPLAGDPGDLRDARWTEVWTVQRGPRRVEYRIAFAGEGRGRGISFQANRLVVAKAE